MRRKSGLWEFKSWDNGYHDLETYMESLNVGRRKTTYIKLLLFCYEEAGIYG